MLENIPLHKDLEQANDAATVQVKCVDGSSESIKLGSAVQERYLDECTHGGLDIDLVKAARCDEISDFSFNTWKLTTESEARKKPNATVVGGRWVLCNKGGNVTPNVRARSAATGVDRDADLAFYAATPPLEAIRMLLSKHAHAKHGGATDIKLNFRCIKKAYFNALSTHEVYARVPRELGIPPGTIGKLKRCCYGTRDAGMLWEEAYSKKLAAAGSTRGRASPCCVFAKSRRLAAVCHGDDFGCPGFCS